jgi:hypothetical protein
VWAFVRFTNSRIAPERSFADKSQSAALSIASFVMCDATIEYNRSQPFIVTNLPFPSLAYIVFCLALQYMHGSKRRRAPPATAAGWRRPADRPRAPRPSRWRQRSLDRRRPPHLLLLHTAAAAAARRRAGRSTSRPCVFDSFRTGSVQGGGGGGRGGASDVMILSPRSMLTDVCVGSFCCACLPASVDCLLCL